MTPEEFKRRAQEIYDECQGDAGTNNGLGHIAMDCLMEDCLREAGYGERIEIFDKFKHVRY